jgi:hypothetical protein
MGSKDLKWNQESTMPSKKPPVALLAAANATTRPPLRKNTSPAMANIRQQPDNRWQRTKRYGWDSR